ncbi:hypothetical protein BGX31_005264 [Mortierella sp. GBA43]|nr:hypothetical protein BGX31_005264 [Mortierella sp. GBA43]
MALSSLPAWASALLLFFCFSSTLALPIDSSTFSLSFFTASNDLIPGPNATIQVRDGSCISIPSLATSFRSNSTQAVFAVYQDDTCLAYLYSVDVSLSNVHGARSLAWVGVDPAQTHAPGDTFTDPAFTYDADKERSRKTQLMQIVVVSVSSVLFLIALGVYLCYMDNKRNQKRGGIVPEPPKEAPGSGRSDGHHRSVSSSSSVTYLPPYASEGYTKAAAAGHDSATTPEARIVISPSEKNDIPAARYNLPTRERSISKLTNQIGTGAGLEPGAVQQGRNAGFGLGYDPNENRGHARRESEIILKNAVITPLHSPILRPSSVISDNGMVSGRGSLQVNSNTIRAPA